jgi:DNA repair protein RadC
MELMAAFEIGRRAQAEQGGERPVFRSPEDVARRMVPLLRDRQTEVFYVLVMDSKNALKIDVELSIGTLNASLVHPREVYKVAIDNGAAPSLSFTTTRVATRAEQRGHRHNAAAGGGWVIIGSCMTT